VNKEASDAGEIVVCYGGTLLQRISEWVSLITVIGIVVYIARKRCCNVCKKKRVIGQNVLMANPIQHTFCPSYESHSKR
jgi:hypothetical protein